MFKNFLITGWRNLLKNKTYVLINVLGLSVSLISCLFIAIYIHHESSYDSFYEDSDRIYRIALNRIYPERTRVFASSPVTLTPTLLEHYPEVESATRMHRLFFNPEVPVQIGDKSFIESKFLFADSSFFDVFSFDFIEGIASTALNGPNKVVLTKQTAQRFFGNQPALNQTFQSNNVEYLVSGVVEELPGNAHFHFDLLGSIHVLGFIQNAINSGSWINPWIYSYIKLKVGVSPDSFEEKLPAMVERFGKGNLVSSLGTDYESLGHRLVFFLQPLKDIHLHSNLDIEIEANSSAKYLYILAIIAFLILTLSCINFVNLSTARSTERGREVGIRKVLGSSRIHLLWQFILESIGTSLLSLMISVLAAFLLIDSFNQLIGKDLNLWEVFQPVSMLIGILIVIVIGFISGIYPAVVMASIKSAEVLKGSYKSSAKGLWIRNALIVVQFFITITMITGTFLISNQMEYLESKDLGFDKEQLLIVRQSQSIGQNYTAFKNRVEQLADVISVGGTNSMPGDFMGSNIFRPIQSGASDMRANVTFFDDDFAKTINYRILEGRLFSEDFDDSNSIIVNEAAVKEMGFEKAVGQRIRVASAPDTVPDLTIIGVVEDFNFASLHAQISPLVLNNTGENTVPFAIAIRTIANRDSQLEREIEMIWNELSPNQSLRLSYLDEELNNLYSADRMTGRIFKVFTLIAIIIAFVGLFSLASYAIQLRTKEISMRKVLGASFSEIIILLSRKLMLLVIIAFGLSIPLSYYITKNWLEQFAYHINIEWIEFLKSGGIAIVLVLLAILHQSIRIFSLNPVETLKAD